MVNNPNHLLVQVIASMRQRGVKPDAATFHAPLARYFRSGRVEDAEAMMATMAACGLREHPFFFLENPVISGTFPRPF